MFTMMRDMIGFLKRSHPELIARYKEVMPYSKYSAGSIKWITYQAIETGVVASLVKTFFRIRKPIVVYFVPALKFGLWNMYVNRGMSDQVAANKVYLLRAYARMIRRLALIVAVIVGVSLAAWFFIR
jgi:hypothetical protein